MIPSWQFSQDPGVNIKLNPHVQFPPGWTQSTPQPVGPYYASPRTMQANLGASCVCDSGREYCCDSGGKLKRFLRPFAGGSLRDAAPQAESWLHRNRKALIIGGLSLITAAGVGVTAMLVK